MLISKIPLGTINVNRFEKKGNLFFRKTNQLREIVHQKSKVALLDLPICTINDKNNFLLHNVQFHFLTNSFDICKYFHIEYFFVIGISTKRLKSELKTGFLCRYM